MIRQPLDKALRRTLEASVVKARDIAEKAATQSLTQLSIGDAKPADYLSDQQRKLRKRLRAHGRQLGDNKDTNGQQSIHKLVTEVAYEHWHRMLFARFLEQNNLLMYDEHTSLTLADCNELVQESDVARDELERGCESGWELAGVLASKMLPQIFRIDSPVFELEFAPEHQRSLEQLVTGLALETFQAQDSLGWAYQFWQSKRKEEVNKSEVKIGADELSPVTQLFTEPYMVSFLLDNALGAWWAGQRLSESDWQQASSEQELREKASIPGVPLSYLRFVKDEQTQQWQPASGTFDAWPKQLSELKALDPCCGSGHFLVAAFLMLVPMRMQVENLTAHQAIDKVLSENLHGLELDQRCVELAAFALALEAWRYPQAGGYRALPELNLACSGISIHTAKDEWKAITAAAGKQNLTIALDWLFQTFKDAPVLGSLINPRRSHAAKIVPWKDLQQALASAFKTDEQLQKNSSGDELTNRIEAGIVAQGLAKSFELLTGQYTWVITNVPYKKTNDLTDELRSHIESYYPVGSAALETAFYERCMEFCASNGVASIVLPQNWMFLKTYEKFREKVLHLTKIHSIARLGSRAFETITGEVVKAVLLTSTVNRDECSDYTFFGYDVSEFPNAMGKADSLKLITSRQISQSNCLRSPDSRILMDLASSGELLMKLCGSYVGLQNGDTDRFVSNFWQINPNINKWVLFQMPTKENSFYSGLEGALLWESGKGALINSSGAYIKGKEAWGKCGVCIRLTDPCPVTLYRGNLYDQSSAAIIPENITHLPAIWQFLGSNFFRIELNKIDLKRNKTNSTFVKVPFDLPYWSKIAAVEYPKGLPKPYSNDPTQWIFHGHPCGSVVWEEDSKWTAHGELRVEDSVLQVAVARLLGYRWPAELDSEMELAAEQREWVEHCQELDAYSDDDGIVCLPAVRGEKAADLRLEALLQAAYGKAWTTPLKNRLLETVGSSSLNLWLRDKFFEQHCKMFQHRPFIWHIWDGLKDGFSALVNYHKLDKAGLERLVYTYLGDWIRTQQSGMTNGEDGAQERLAAAEALKRELEAILEGETPYDIFVRWKSLSEQPIGWTPDLNDGVRLNIRPFLKARDVSKKDAGILRWKPNIKWTKDRGADVASAPWYDLGLEYDGKQGDRINDHHLSLAEKRKARD